MSIRRGLLLLLPSLAVASCSSSGGSGDAPSTEGAGATGDAGAVSQTVGTSGGTVTAPSVALTFAPGSLVSSTTITVNAAGSPPQGYVGLSQLFDFGPDGITFPQPVKVSFTCSGGLTPAVFWSNAQGGYDELATTTTGNTASAQVTHFSHGFCGESKKGMDASVSSSGSSSGSSGGPGSSGSSGGSSSGSSSGSASGSSGAASSGSSSGTGPSSSGSSSSSSGSSSSSSSGGSSGSSSSSSGGSSGSSGSSTDGGVTDSGASGDDASTTLGIEAMLDGVPATFAYNITVTPLQTWWLISADDVASGPHWTLSLLTYINPGTLNCSGGVYPSMNYRHYASSDAGADTTFTSENAPGSSCTIDETSSSMDAGSVLQGTFSAVLLSGVGDAGSSHTFSGGSYDVVVP